METVQPDMRPCPSSEALGGALTQGAKAAGKKKTASLAFADILAKARDFFSMAAEKKAPASSKAQGLRVAIPRPKAEAPGKSGTEKVETSDKKRKESPKAPAQTASSAAELLSAAAAQRSSAKAATGLKSAASEGQSRDEASERGKKIGNVQGRGEPRLSLLDMRRAAKKAQEGREAEGVDNSTADKAPFEIKVKEGTHENPELFRELRLDFPRGGTQDSPRGVEGGREPAAGDSRGLLAQRLRESGNAEIVQSARIILKDGDAGTIRLRLRPESLGDVKIELNLSDNNISGKILVQSDEAKTAFERNMASLADAFTQGGFDSARLEVSVGSGSGRRDFGGGSEGGAAFFSERLRSEEFAARSFAQAGSGGRGLSIDLLA